MTWTAPRSARILFASTLALAALGAASALSAEPPPASTAHPSDKRIDEPSVTTAQQAPAPCTAVNVERVKIASDPEEGGQVTARRSKAKPPVGDLTVTKHTDTASTKLMDAPAPGTTCPPPQH